MIWGCMTAKGVGNLAVIPTTMTQVVYRQILEDNLKMSATKLRMGRRFIFQQDNDPKHTAKSVKEWFKQRGVNVLDWPAQSPDMNPIEHLWNHLENRLAARPQRPKNARELEAALREEWGKIDSTYTKKLVDSMPRRIQALISAKGLHTKY